MRRFDASHPVAVWFVRNVVAPLDRHTVRVFGGRVRPPSGWFVPTLIITTRGRRTGLLRTTPLIYVVDGDDFVVGNARPAGERVNPWVLNLKADPTATVDVDGERSTATAFELDPDEVERWWPELVERWPAFADHFAVTGERTLFRLTPVEREPTAQRARG